MAQQHLYDGKLDAKFNGVQGLDIYPHVCAGGWRFQGLRQRLSS